MNPTAIVSLVAVFIIIVLIVWFVWRRGRAGGAGGIVQLSHLKCGKCGGVFDYAWIPGMSITALRLFGSRLFACPVCRKWSVFDIWNTRVDPGTHHCDIQVGPS